MIFWTSCFDLMPKVQNNCVMLDMKSHDNLGALFWFHAQGSKQLCYAGHEITWYLGSDAFISCQRNKTIVWCSAWNHMISWNHCFDSMPKVQNNCVILGMKSHDILEAMLWFHAQGTKQLCDAGHDITWYLGSAALISCPRVKTIVWCWAWNHMISWNRCFDSMPKVQNNCVMLGMKSHDILEVLLWFLARGSKQLCDARHKSTWYFGIIALIPCPRFKIIMWCWAWHHMISWKHCFDFLPKV